jgi:plasmid stabilization system protein ParE
MKSLVLLNAAIEDIDEIEVYYFEQGGETLALSFINSFQLLIARIQKRPATGSLRFAKDLELISPAMQ